MTRLRWKLLLLLLLAAGTVGRTDKPLLVSLCSYFRTSHSQDGVAAKQSRL